MNDENKVKVGIVILNWNNYKDTNRCLKTLLEISYTNYFIYLLDNGSTDNSFNRIKNEYKNDKVEFIANENNLGFSAGCNPGIIRALSNKCQYILLLNNDCIIFDKNFLQKGVDIGETNKECGIVGGKILFWPETNKIWSTGGHISFFGGEKHLGYNEIDNGKYDVIAKRKFISGALMLVKAEVFIHIGLLSEVYFFGKEEWEFSTRAIKEGYKLVYNPNFSVQHEASNSHDWVNPKYVYNGTLSKILYKKRNMTKLQFRIWYTLFGIYLYILFPIKYHIFKKNYLQNVSPIVLRHVMKDAFNDSNKIIKVTSETLEKYMSRYA